MCPQTITWAFQKSKKPLFGRKTRWSRTGLEQDRELEREVKVMVCEARDRVWTTYMEETNEDSNRSSAVLKRIGRRRESNAPIKVNDTYWYKAERATEYLENCFKNELEPDMTAKVQKSILRFRQSLPDDPPIITMDEISSMLKLSHRRKFLVQMVLKYMLSSCSTKTYSPGCAVFSIAPEKTVSSRGAGNWRRW